MLDLKYNIKWLTSLPVVIKAIDVFDLCFSVTVLATAWIMWFLMGVAAACIVIPIFMFGFGVWGVIELFKRGIKYANGHKGCS